jgi:transcriptional regulator with XRE-family HTH domain
MCQRVFFSGLEINHNRLMSDKTEMQIEQDEDGLFIVYYSVLEYFLRSFLGLIQKVLAKGSAVSDNMISKFEGAKRSVKATNLYRIVLKLGISAEDFDHILENKSVMEELVSRIELDQPIDHQKVRQAMMQFTKDAELNFSSMQILVSHHRYAHAFHFFYRYIQDFLFALFIKTHQVTSPLVENNSYLLNTIDPKKAKEQKIFLDTLKEKLLKRDLSVIDFNHLLLQSMNLRKWLKNKLTEPMTPPPKLKYDRTKTALRKKIKELKESIAKK